jgi:uncharacterized protein
MSVGTASYASTVDATDFEPFMVGDKQIGTAHWLRQTGSGADAVLAGLWHVDPVTFEFEFPGDETFHILAGSMRINVHDGDALELSEGSIASIAKGTSVTWEILSPVRKFFVLTNL